MIEKTSDDKNLFKVFEGAIIRNESFCLLVKGEKARLFKKLIDFEPEYEKTNNFFSILKFFLLQMKIPSIWSIKHMAEFKKYEIKISELNNGDISMEGLPKIS